MVTYTGGDPCPEAPSVNRQMRVAFICDPSGERSPCEFYELTCFVHAAANSMVIGVVQVSGDDITQGECTYTVDIRSAAACPSYRANDLV